MVLRSSLRTVAVRLRRESGAVATEYALLLGLLALAIIAAVTALGLALAGAYGNASTQVGGI
jgi:Flp pilus assembly pilin Flp